MPLLSKDGKIKEVQKSEILGKNKFLNIDLQTGSLCSIIEKYSENGL